MVFRFRLLIVPCHCFQVCDNFVKTSLSKGHLITTHHQPLHTKPLTTYFLKEKTKKKESPSGMAGMGKKQGCAVVYGASAMCAG